MALKSFGGFVDKNSQNPAKYLARTKKTPRLATPRHVAPTTTKDCNTESFLTKRDETREKPPAFEGRAGGM